jgi:hypothetical protein
MGLSLPVLAIIGHLFITRYGALRGSSTPVKRRRFRIALPPILARIPIRLPGRLPAMIWLELRQSMPLAAFGLLLAVPPGWPDHLSQHPAGSCHKRNNKFASARGGSDVFPRHG